MFHSLWFKFLLATATYSNAQVSLLSKMTSSPITPAFRAQLDLDRYHEHRLGCWLPKDRKIIVAWVKQLMKRVRAGDPQDGDLDPTLLKLQELVSKDPILKPLSDDMFKEVPNIDPYNKDPEGSKELRSFDEMLTAFNSLLKQGPQWNDIANKVGLIGCPFNAVLDWPMATASGYMFFLYPRVNECLKAMLNKWEEYLQSPASVEVLKPADGWLGKGFKEMLRVGNSAGVRDEVHIVTHYTFTQLYKCPKPDDTATYGFTSWDRFFTREFNDNIRRIPDDATSDSVIIHACESAPLQYPVSKVQRSDNFQGKNQCYSLIDMMNQNKLAERFVGGTVYQAFLSCLSYHRWHAPVSGKIVETEVVAGTYYSQNLYQTFFGHWPDKPDPAGPTWSQPYIASVAARGLIFIQADNPAIGLICFIAIGMTDTSGCEMTVKPGDSVKKGDQMGMFHFGGSSHCLVFEPHVKLDWKGIPPQNSKYWPKNFSDPDDMPNFPVRSMLATVGG